MTAPNLVHLQQEVGLTTKPVEHGLSRRDSLTLEKTTSEQKQLKSITVAFQMLSEEKTTASKKTICAQLWSPRAHSGNFRKLELELKALRNHCTVVGLLNHSANELRQLSDDQVLSSATRVHFSYVTSTLGQGPWP